MNRSIGNSGAAASYRGAAALCLLMVLAAAAAPAATAAAQPAKESASPVDINTAAAADLEKVPGIGPSLSKRIIEFREKNGPYQSVDDLLKVQGIGEKSLAKFREYLTAGKPPKK